MKFESSSAISKGLGNALEVVSEVGSLPLIRGKWFFVDPTSGANTSDGRTIDTSVADLHAAYDKLADGDGVALLSYGATAAATTSYLKHELTWALNGITVVGIAAPVAMFGRARVANKTVATTATLTAPSGGATITRAAGSFVTDGWIVGMAGTCAGAHTDTFVVSAVSALTLTLVGTVTASAGGITSITSYNVNLLTISGANNRFYNIHFFNGGTAAAEVGGVAIEGARNYFQNCHFVGGAGAAAAATKYSLKLSAAEENTFVDCVVGSDSFDHGNNADCDVLLSGTVKRNRFKGCEFIAFASAGTAHGFVKSATTTGGSPTVFDNCYFNGLLCATAYIFAAAFIKTGNCDKIGIHNCTLGQVTAWGAGVWVYGAASAASAGGAISTAS
jgi:hypothetical protein